MYTDISRDSYDADRNISGVLFQQGRPFSDADLNEAFRQQQEVLRTMIRDIIGPFGGPDRDLEYGALCGFEIVGGKDAPLPLLPAARLATLTTDANKKTGGDFFILPGRYYVGGMLIQAGGTFETPWRYLQQPDWNDQTPLDKRRWLVYLEVWERHALPFEIDGLADSALTGVDPTHRSRIVWQVKVSPAEGDGSTVTMTDERIKRKTEIVDDKDIVVTTNGKKGDPIPFDDPQSQAAPFFNAFLPLWKHAGLPRPWTPNDPARPRPTGELRTHLDAPASFNEEQERLPPGFRGPSHQLYRVEIHEATWNDGKLDALTFKWSRNNGSTVFEIRDKPKVNGTEKTLEVGLATGPYADLTDLPVNVAVEVLNKSYLDGHPWRGKLRSLLKVVDVQEDDDFGFATLAVNKDQAGKSNDEVPTLPENETAFLRVWANLEDTQAYKGDDPKTQITPALKGGAVALHLQDSAGSEAPIPMDPLGLRIILEHGLAIEFRGSGLEGELQEGDFQPGDHWLISARTGMVWGKCAPKPGDTAWQSPRRIEHFLAPLALIDVADNSVNRLQDLRTVVTPNFKRLK